MVLICFSLMINNVDHLYLFVGHFYGLEEVLIHVLYPLSIDIFAFTLLIM